MTSKTTKPQKSKDMLIRVIRVAKILAKIQDKTSHETLKLLSNEIVKQHSGEKQN
jgi:hypothetical protein